MHFLVISNVIVSFLCITDHVINKIKLKQSCWISFKQTLKYFNSPTICIYFKEEQELKVMHMD